MNGKNALLDHHHDDDYSRANFDTIFSGGSVSLSKLLLMPASFQNTNINNFPPTSPILPPPPHDQHQLSKTSLDGHHHRLSLSSSHHPDQQTLLNQSLLPFRQSHKRPRQQQLIKHLPSIVPTSALARQRRARMSDKTRCLQKLIPLDRHMDTATLYEETYKYIKFLEAQITVLHSMPLQTTTTTTIKQLGHEDILFYGGVLGRLNRQQLLQVLTNSQVAQTVMYTAGWCVFSAEQLRMINDSHPFI